MQNTSTLSLIAFSAMAIAATIRPVQAQDGASQGLDEIVVTARKREETLQTIPLAVTAITAEQIERAGIKDVTGLIASDPSLNFDQGIAPYDTRIVIRGLSPTRGRPNVASLVDGIDVSSEAIGVAGGSMLINPRLIDIARVEIVKGPQSALYGRSAFAGAINYITLDPGTEVSGSFGAEMNEHAYQDFKASLSIPVRESLGFRLNGYWFNSQGFYQNSITGADVGGGNGKGASLSMKWTPNEIYSLKTRVEYSDDGFDEPAQANVAFNGRSTVPAAASSCRVYSHANPAGGNFFVTGPILDPTCANLDANALIVATIPNQVARLETATGNRGIFNDANIVSFRGAIPNSRSLAIAFNPDYTQSTDNGATAPKFGGSDRQVLRLSAVQQFTLPLGAITSLTGYTRADVNTDFDFDKTAELSIMNTLKTWSRTEQFSQELRFTSSWEGPVSLIAGAQYWTERMDQFDRNNTVVGSGTACVLINPMATCPPPAFGFGFTSTNVAQFMDNAAAARRSTLVRRFVNHQSAYLDIEWEFADTLKLIAEARYVTEDNDVVGPVTQGAAGAGTTTLCGSTGPCTNTAAIPYSIQGAPATFAGAAVLRYDTYTRNDSYLTPKATIQWQPSPQWNIYGSYSIGEKPGGFGTLTVGAFGLPARADVEFLPEKVKVYELGAKWVSADRRALVNAAFFKQDFTDKQVSSQVIIGNTLGNRITNAGGAEAQGMELTAQWRATPYLTLGAGITQMFKYEFTDYTTLTSGAAEIARVGNCVPVITLNAAGTGAAATCRVTRTGNKMEDVAATALAVNAGWRHPVGGSGWTFTADLDGKYEGKRFIEDDNTIWLDPYFLTGVRLGLETEHLSLQLFVDNLSDDRKVKSAGTGPGTVFANFRTGITTGAPSPITAPASLALRSVFAPQIPTSVFANMPNPRTVGLRVNYKF